LLIVRRLPFSQVATGSIENTSGKLVEAFAGFDSRFGLPDWPFFFKPGVPGRLAVTDLVFGGRFA
jgi:hypothetical protein